MREQLLNMAPKSKLWHPASAIFFSVLVSVFIIVGVPVLGDALVKILPTKETSVSVLGSEVKTAVRVRRQGSQSYYVKIQYADGSARSLFCLKNLYSTVARSGTPKQAILRESVLFSKPVAIDYPSKKNSGETETHTLLLSNMVLLVGGVLCWGIVAYLLIKLPNKKQFPWLIFTPFCLGATALGVWWWV